MDPKLGLIKPDPIRDTATNIPIWNRNINKSMPFKTFLYTLKIFAKLNVKSSLLKNLQFFLTVSLPIQD